MPCVTISVVTQRECSNEARGYNSAGVLTFSSISGLDAPMHNRGRSVLVRRLVFSLVSLVILLLAFTPGRVSSMSSRGGPAYARTLSFASPAAAGLDAARLERAFSFVQHRVGS